MLQVPTVVVEVKQALADGHCCIIGLQATGEAAAQVHHTKLRPKSGVVDACVVSKPAPLLRAKSIRSWLCRRRTCIATQTSGAASFQC